ncbi:flavohemoglobin expression-modulating QEGLA motif protein [Parapedobacter deserti]|uniref:Flavohemoglobin expression-modulating QEGLA motif protein n=1 Tax=Parapedobacter deserti TaxID=1912957 RepID=A0ABV7JTV6_9SPHI
MNIDIKKQIHRILDKLKKGYPLHADLPYGGKLHMERPVPYLLVYRVPPHGEDSFTSTLGKTESAYLVAPDTEECPVTPIIRAIASTMADKFGGFLLLEVWLSDRVDSPPFTIHLSQKSALAVAEKLQTELQQIKLVHQTRAIEVGLDKGKKMPSPPYHHELFNAEEARKSEIIVIGLEITPIYMNHTTGAPYPLFLRELREHFGKALRKSFFEFVRMKTSYSAAHFEMLGMTELDEVVWEIDGKLAEYSNQFDFLLLVTPINTQEAWSSFAKSKYRKTPAFHYRPMPIDPELIKRKLYNLRIEDIPDPTIAFLFRDKRKEIDRMLNMLSDREKPDFLYSSQQLFGNIEENLLETARAILVAADPNRLPLEKEMIGAKEFAAMASVELEYLKQQYDMVSTAVRVRDDVEGVMVSRGTLNISSRYRISRERAFSLLQHEVGTHVATYYNGMAQPFKLFYLGVPGYEQLQEGLAVLSEYMTGGLTNQRMRILAARVVVVHHMLAGNSFIDTFYLLTDKYGFKHEVAFQITMRVYRGGGLTKDAVYLKGLLNVIEYIKEGNDISKLLVGKIRQDYLPIIEELMHRQLLKPSPLRPKFLEYPYIAKIDEIKKAGSVFKMIN